MKLILYDAEEYDRLIKPLKFTTKINCIWPLDRDSGTKAKIFRIFHLVVFYFMTISMTVAVGADAIYHIDDLDEATERGLISTAFLLCVIRLTICTIHQKDILYVVETMRNDWISSPYEDKVVLKRKCLFTFSLAKYFIATVFITLFVFAIAPSIEMLQTKELILPFRGYFLVNITESSSFVCLYLYNVVAGKLCGTYIAGMTSFTLIVIMHASAKFAILRNRLETLKYDDSEIGILIGQCVKDHQDAIFFADTVENILNAVALGQFVVSTGLVCFAGFQITSMMEDRGRLMKYSAFLNSAILELFLFSFSGQELINESETIGASAYNGDWIGGNFAHDLQIMMMRSRVPNKVTAAKFYSMSLESFSAVLSTSFSYFTVLKSASED